MVRVLSPNRTLIMTIGFWLVDVNGTKIKSNANYLVVSTNTQFHVYNITGGYSEYSNFTLNGTKVYDF